jgi:hypothetical protein
MLERYFELQPVFWISESEMLLGSTGGDPSARCALKEPELEEIWLVDTFDRIRFFACRGG